MAQQNGDSSEPSSRAPVAFPDFRLFDSAQDILDHNKRLIKELKVNHEAQTSEALARNCLLIRELNTNIAAVMRAYNSIGDSFEAYMDTQQQLQQQQQQQLGGAAGQEVAAQAQQQAAAQPPAQAQQQQQQQAQPLGNSGSGQDEQQEQELASSQQGAVESMDDDDGQEETAEDAAVPEAMPA
ncbi:ELF4-LIKE 3-like [Chlorella sorokiniana]|uniref:ELF4-LIKE 3-like n=1 Tax=Chlorella sorokiniana TaxID=3076 RepID=A0A2P6TBP6_CHLSO|nr:ELF4-LIKE 3-like [Chlorella sorokiniana]|eukprot:PRW18295.1 ELF4-LIKE 3-like [Chlorella sorokiniana]